MSVYAGGPDEGAKAVLGYDAETGKQLWARDGFARIVNTTPNGVHLETTLAAADAGKPTFLDKPIANTIADARAMSASKGAKKCAGVTLW